jgi:hypothetical protein
MAPTDGRPAGPASERGSGPDPDGYLHDAILAALPEAAVRSTRITPFGVTYEVVVMIDGLNGATMPVVTTWIIDGDAQPRLTSTWVDIP